MAEGTSRRVLIVEDEMMIAMLMEDMIRDLGYEVVGPAMTLRKALQLAQDDAFDCAILDINLGHGLSSTSVAVTLAARGIPFAFSTGYGAKGVPEPFDTTLVLKKPFRTEDLKHALRQLMP